jgi:hypothetical protein
LAAVGVETKAKASVAVDLLLLPLFHFVTHHFFNQALRLQILQRARRELCKPPSANVHGVRSAA